MQEYDLVLEVIVLSLSSHTFALQVESCSDSWDSSFGGIVPNNDICSWTSFKIKDGYKETDSFYPLYPYLECPL